MTISLDKIANEAPELLDLTKKVQLNLDKHQLSDHTARVVLVLDISASMDGLYRSKKVDELVKRVMPLGLQFDDDGQIDVYAFGTQAHDIGEYGMSNYKNCVKEIQNSHRLEGGTNYGKALALIERKYGNSNLPVYVMFVTDGDTQDRDEATSIIKNLSSKPVFLQFIGLGESYFPDEKPEKTEKKALFGKLFGSSDDSSTPSSGGFKYLATLDDMGGRAVDNCNFFAIKNPTAVDETRLYELLMNEYPQWLKAARSKGILR